MGKTKIKMQNYSQNLFRKNTLFEPSNLVFRQAKRPSSGSSGPRKRLTAVEREKEWETWRKKRGHLLDHEDFFEDLLDDESLFRGRREFPKQKIVRLFNLLKNHPLTRNLRIRIGAAPEKGPFIVANKRESRHLVKEYYIDQLPENFTEEALEEFINKMYDDLEKMPQQKEEDLAVFRSILRNTGAVITKKKETKRHTKYELAFPVEGKEKKSLYIDFHTRGFPALQPTWKISIQEKRFDLPLGLGDLDITNFVKYLEERVKEIKKDIELERNEKQLLSSLASSFPDYSFNFENKTLTISHKGFFIGIINADASKVIATKNPIKELEEKITKLAKARIKDLNTVKNYIESELDVDDTLTYTKITDVDYLQALSYTLTDESEETLATINIKPSSIEIKDASGKNLQIFGNNSFPTGDFGKATITSLKKLYGTGLAEKIKQLAKGEITIDEEKNKKLNELKILMKAKTLFIAHSPNYIYNIVTEQKTGKYRLNIHDERLRKPPTPIYAHDLPEDFTKDISNIGAILDIVKMRTVEVSNVQDLIDNIAPYTIINLAPGTYDLSKLKEVKSKHVEKVKVYDSFEIHIKKVKGLIIRGPKEGKATILTKPELGWTFYVENSENITFENLTLGHTTPGACAGGVLGFNNSKIIRIKNCDLFGCGTEGLGINNVKNLQFIKSIIRDCTIGIMSIKDSTDLRFVDSKIKNNKTTYYGFIINYSENISFDECSITDNAGYSQYLFDATNSKKVTVKNSSIKGHKNKGLYKGDITFLNTKISGNKFNQKRKPKQK